MLNKQKVRALKSKADKAHREFEIQKKNDIDVLYRYVREDQQLNSDLETTIAHNFFSLRRCFDVACEFKINEFPIQLPRHTLVELLCVVMGKRLRELGFIDTHDVNNHGNISNPRFKEINTKKKFWSSEKITLLASVQYDL